MKHNGLRWLVGGLAILILGLSSTAITVREGHTVIVTRFGEPRVALSSPGLAWKLPWPIDRATEIDGRSRVLDTRHSEVLTRDKKNVILLSYAVWRVGDPLAFYRAVGTTEQAVPKLEGLLIDAKTNVLGSFDLAALVSTDPEQLAVDRIEEELRLAVVDVAQERYGIVIENVGFKRLSLPEENLSSVFNQMRAERARQAAEFRAEGERRAQELRAETDRQVAEILAEADEEAAKVRGSAVAESQALYNQAHREDPELYKFLRRLESLERLLGAGASLVLRTDSAPFDLLPGEREDDEELPPPGGGEE